MSRLTAKDFPQELLELYDFSTVPPNLLSVV